MSFRRRVFLLVILVTLVGIGATASLTLRIADQRASTAAVAAYQHHQETVAALEQYGRVHGTWAGVHQVALAFSRSRGQRIRLTSADLLTVYVDTDNEAGRSARPVPADSSWPVDPNPQLPVFWPPGRPDPAPPAAAGGAGPAGVARPPAAAGGIGPVGVAAPAVAAGSSADRVARLAAQYREGSRTVACLDRLDGFRGGHAMTDAPPYLTDEVRAEDPECTRASRSTRAETAADADAVRACGTGARTTPAGAALDNVTLICLQDAFRERTRRWAPDQLVVHLGAADYGPGQLLVDEALAGAAAMLTLALGGALLIARQLSRPVGRLTAAAGRLADGDLDVRVPDAGKDELAELSRSFNRMAEAVQRSEERQRRLVADVAHELRTPLSNLRGYLEGLQDGVVPPSRELFASLHEETLLQRRILDDLQVLVLAEAGDLGYAKQPVDLAELARFSVTVHRAVAAEAGVELASEAPDEVWVVADPDRLRQVLGNLLTNAIRHTGAGGRVTVRAFPADDGATLSVRDTGEGIAAADLPRVFDRFWRADPARQRATGGSGLGLTIARRIVADHGGLIGVTSAPGAGSTFSVWLPPDPSRPPSPR